MWLFYIQGCLEHIEKWTQDQALIMLAVILGIMFVEVTALFSIFLACTRGRNRRSKSQASTFTSTQTLSPFAESEHDFSKKFFCFKLSFWNAENHFTSSKRRIYIICFSFRNCKMIPVIRLRCDLICLDRYRNREQNAHSRNDIWRQIMKMAGGQRRTDSCRYQGRE